ncbi:MAG: hypothetical protein ACRDBG_26045 [Waterburya sp.]
MLSLNQLHSGSDPVLTSVAQDYTVPDNRVGTFIAPLVEVGSRSGRVIRFGKERFAVNDGRRAYGDKVKRIRSQWDTDQYSLSQISLGYEIAFEELEEINTTYGTGCGYLSGAEIDLRTRELDVVMNQVMNSHELKIAEVVRNIASYQSGLGFATATAAGWTPWNAPTAEPISNVVGAARRVAQNIAIRPNSMVLGAKAYDELQTNPDVIARLFYNTTDAVNEQYLSSWFGLSRGVKVAETVVINPATGTNQYAFPENGLLLFYNPLPYEGTVIPADGSKRGQLSSFWTYVLKGTPFVSEEDVNNDRKVVFADVTFEYDVQATTQGVGGTQEGAFFVENIFA